MTFQEEHLDNLQPKSAQNKDNQSLELKYQPFQQEYCLAKQQWPDLLDFCLVINHYFDSTQIVLPVNILEVNKQSRECLIELINMGQKMTVWIPITSIYKFKNEKTNIQERTYKLDVAIPQKLLKMFPQQAKEINKLVQIAHTKLLSCNNFGIPKFQLLNYDVVQHTKQRQQLEGNYSLSFAMMKLKMQFVIFLRKSHGAIFGKFSSGNDFSNEILGLIKDVEGKFLSFEFSTVFKQCIDKTKNNINNLLLKMKTNSVNTNFIQYSVLLLMLFSQEVIPLCVTVWIAQFSKIGNISVDQSIILIKQIYKGTLFELTSSHLSNLNELLTAQKLPSFNTNNDNNLVVFKHTQANIAFNLVFNNFFLINFVPLLEISSQDTDANIQITKESILQWQLGLPLILLCFNSITLNYCSNFNYGNVEYNLQLKLINVKVLIYGGEEQLINIDQKLSLPLQINSYSQACFRDIYYPIDLQTEINTYQNTLEFVLTLNKQLCELFDPDKLKQQYLSFKKTNVTMRTINQVIVEQCLAETLLPPKKLQELDNLHIFNIQPDLLTLNFETISQIFVQMLEQMKELRYIRDQRMYAQLIYVDVQQKINLILSDYKTVQSFLIKDLTETFQLLANKHIVQVQYCRILIQNSQVSPQYFNLLPDIQKFFQKPKLLSVFKNISQVYETNYQHFVETLVASKDQVVFINSSASLFYQPIDCVVDLIYDGLVVQKQIQDYRLQSATLIKQMDDFVLAIMNRCENQVMILLKFSEQEIQLAQSDFKQIVANYPILGNQLIIEQFNFNCNNDDLEFKFLQSFSKVTTMQLCSSVFTREDILKQYHETKLIQSRQDSVSQQQTSIESVINPLSEHFSLIQSTTFSFSDLLSEIKYVIFEVIAIIQCLQYWRLWALKNPDIDRQITCLNVPEYASPTSLYVAISPLIEIIVSFQMLQETIQVLSNRELKYFPARHALEVEEKIQSQIKALRQRILKGNFQIMNNKNDFLKRNVLYRNADERKQFNGKVNLIRQDVEYQQWEQLLKFYENKIIDLLPKLTIFYILQQPSLKLIHFQTLSKIIQLQLDQKLVITPSKIIEAFDKNSTYFEYLLVLYVNSLVDQQALQQLNLIEKLADQIRVAVSFACVISDAGKTCTIQDQNMSFDVNMSELEIPIIYPTSFQAILMESLACVALIINNIGFQGTIELDFKSNYDKMIFQLCQEAREKLHSIVVEKSTREYIDILKQWRYPSKIEQKARDYEAVTQILYSVCMSIQRSGFMLQDLLLQYNFCNIAQVSGKEQLGGFSEQELMLLASFVFQWNNLMTKYFKSQIDVSLLKLSINYSLVEQLYQLNNGICELYEVKKLNSFNIIVKSLNLNNSEDFQLKYRVKTEFGVDSCINTQVIPVEINGKKRDQFYHSLLYDLPIQAVYTKINGQNDINNYFNKLIYIQRVFGQIQKINFKNDCIVSLQSNDEIVVLLKTIPIKNLCQTTSAIFSELAQFFIKTIFDLVKQKPDEQTIFQLLSYQIYELFNIVTNTFIFYNHISKDDLQQLVCNQMSKVQFASDELKTQISQHNYCQTVFNYFSLTEKDIFVSNTENIINMKTGKHWQCLTNFDNKIFSKQDDQVLIQIIQGLTKDSAVFLLGSKERGFQNYQYQNIQSRLSRLVRRYQVSVCLTQIEFTQNIQMVESYLINGYLIFVYGLQFLGEYQIQEFCNILLKIKQKRGVFQTVFSTGMTPQFEPVISEQKLGSILDLGLLVIFLPELQSIEKSNCFVYSNEYEHLSQLPFNKSGIRSQISQLQNYYQESQQKEFSTNSKMVGYLDCFSLVKSQLAQKIYFLFSYLDFISVDTNSLLNDYIDVSEYFGRQFFDIAQNINRLNSSFGQFTVNDMKLIFEKSRDTTNTNNLAALTLDYVMKQSLELLSDDVDNEKMVWVISYYISSCLGLDTIGITQLSIQASQYIAYFESFLQHIGIQRKSRTSGYATNSYEKYFNDYLSKVINSDYAQQIAIYNNLFQLPIQSVVDIIALNDLINFSQPVLLVSLQTMYLRLFFAVLGVIRQVKITYLVFASDLKNLVQQISSNQSQQNYILALAPTSRNELLKMFTDILSFFIPQNYKSIYKNLSVILCLDIPLYESMRDSIFLSLFQNKLTVLPCFSGALGTKRLFMGSFSINKYRYMDMVEEKLFYLWQDIKHIDLIGKLKNLNLSSMQVHSLRSTVIERADNRSVVLFNFLNSFYDLIYDELTKVFHLGGSFEQALILRSLIQLFLYRFGIVMLTKRCLQSQFLAMLSNDNFKANIVQELQLLVNHDNSSLGSDAILRQLIRQYFKSIGLQLENFGGQDAYIMDCLSFTRQKLIQLVEPIIDLGGFLQATFQQYFDQLLKAMRIQSNVQTTLDMVKQLFFNDETQPKGFGFSGSLQFQFSDDFLFQGFFNQISHEEAFQNIMLPMVCAMWNAAHLFYVTVSYTGQWQSIDKGLLQKSMVKKYTAFKEQLASIENINNLFSNSLSPYCVLIALESGKYNNLKKECLFAFTIKNSQSILKIQHGLSVDQLNIIIRSQLNLLSAKLPTSFADQPFCYINITNKLNSVKGHKNYGKYIFGVSFQPFKLGDGILKNVGAEDEIIQCNKNIQQVCSQTALNRSKQLNNQPYNQSFDPKALIEDFDKHNKISVQKLSNQKIYFDSQRTAIIVMIAGCLLSPITSCLTGKKQIGKTMLINTAQLVVRDLIDPHLIQVENTDSIFSTYTIKQSIANRFILRNSEISNNSRYKNFKNKVPDNLFEIHENNVILEYYSSMAFPSIHFHASQIDPQQVIADDLLVLCRDHCLKLDGDNQIYIHNSQEKIAGLVSLSDVSFVIECQNNSQLSQLSAIVIEVPPLSEKFLISLFKLQYPQHSEQWIKHFVNGFFLLKNSFSNEVLHNFEILQHLYQNKTITISKEIIIPQSEIQMFNDKIKNQISSIQFDAMTDNKQFISFVSNQTQQPPHFRIINNSDQILQDLNVHSLFYVLNQYIDSDVMFAIQERLNSLQILGYLQSDDQGNGPWKDCIQITNFNQYMQPSWRSFIFSQKIQSFKSVNSNDLRGNIEIDQDLTIFESNKENSYLEDLPEILNRDLLITLGYYRQNFRFFKNFMDLYAQNSDRLDPMITSIIFQAFLNIMQQREINQTKLSTIVQLGVSNNNPYSLSGICAEDELLNARYYIAQFTAKYSAFVYNNICRIRGMKVPIENIKQLIEQDREVMSVDEAEGETGESIFGGFTHSAALSLKCPRIHCNIVSGSEQIVDLAVQLIKGFANYKIYHIDNPQQLIPNEGKADKLNLENESNTETKSQVSNWSANKSVSSSMYSSLSSRKLAMSQKYLIIGRNENLVNEMMHMKVIIDVDNILNTLEQLSEQPKKYKEENFEIIHFLFQIRSRIQKDNTSINDSQLQFLLILIILRIAVALAIGIRPDQIFDINSSCHQIQQYLGISISTKFSSLFPFKIVPQGRFISQLPVIATQPIEMRKRIDNKYKHGNRYLSKTQILDSITTLPIEVLIIGSRHVFDVQSPTGISILSLFNNMLEPFSILPSIFSEEELQVFSILACHNYMIETIMDRKFLSSLLASNVSIFIIDQQQKQQPLLVGSTLGTIKPFIFQHMLSLKQQYSMFNDIKRNNLSFNSSFVKFMQVPRKTMPLYQKINSLQNSHAQSNLINFYPLDIFRTFSISGIQLIKEFKFQSFQFDYNSFLQQYIIASFTSFKLFSQLSNAPVLSFSKFVSVANQFCNQVFDIVSNLDEIMVVTKQLQMKFSQMTQFTKQEYREIDLRHSDEQFFKDVIDKLVSKVHYQMKTVGQQLTPNIEQIQRSVAMCLISRDYFITFSKTLELEIGRINQMLFNLPVDIIGCVCYLFFSINDNVSVDQLNYLITVGTFGDLGNQLTQIYLKIKQQDKKLDLFQLIYLAQLNQQGLPVSYYQQGDLVDFQHLSIGQFGSKNGKEQIFYNYLSLIKADYPVFQMLNEFKADWYFSDPYHTVCSTVVSMWKIGYKNFILNDVVSIIASNSLSVFQKLQSFTQYIFQPKGLRPLIALSSAGRIIIDLTKPTQTVMQNFKVAFNDVNKVIVFKNVESCLALKDNVSILRHFMQLKLGEKTKQLKNFKLGSQQFSVKGPIGNWTTIVSISFDIGLNQILQMLDCLGQPFIDQIFCATPNFQKFSKQKVPQQLKIQQQLTQSIFGTESSERMYAEELHAFEIQKTQNLLSLLPLLQSLNKLIIIDEEKLVDKYHNCLHNINDQQHIMFNNICQLVITIQQNMFMIKDYLNNSMKMVEVGSEQQLMLLKNQITRKHGTKICIGLSKALYYSQQFIRKFSYIHTPLQSLDNLQFYEQIFNQTQNCIENFQSNCIHEFSKIQLPELEANLKYFKLLYPIQFEIQSDISQLQQQLINTIIPIYTSKLTHLVDKDIFPVIWLIVVVIFLSQTDLLRSDFQNCVNDGEVISRILSNNIDDIIKLAATQQLSVSFSQGSTFSISRLYSPHKIKQIVRIGNTKTLQPEICQMSNQLSYAWLVMHIIGRYSKMMHSTLTWFMKNNAAFVNLTNVKVPFLSLIRGYNQRNPRWGQEFLTSTYDHRWLFDTLFKSKFSGQVQTLPPVFYNPEPISFFNSFCIATVLKPEQFQINLQVLGSVLQQYTGQSPYRQLNLINDQFRCHTNYIVNKNETIQSSISHEQLMDIMKEPMTQFSQLFGDVIIDQSIFNCSFISLFDLVNKQVTSHFANVEQKKFRPQVVFIYYDKCLAIQIILQFIIKLVLNHLKQQIQVVLCKEYQSNQAQKQILIIDIESVFLFPQLLEHIYIDLLNAIESKKSFLPLFFIIRSNQISSTIHDPIYNARCDFSGEQIKQYIHQLNRMVEILVPSFIYFQKPHNMFEQMLHSYLVQLAQFNLLEPTRWLKSKKIGSSKILFMQLLQQSMIFQLGINSYSDFDLLSQFVGFMNKLQLDIKSKNEVNDDVYAKFYLSIRNDSCNHDDKEIQRVSTLIQYLYLNNKDIGDIITEGLSVVFIQTRQSASQEQLGDQDDDFTSESDIDELSQHEDSNSDPSRSDQSELSITGKSTVDETSMTGGGLRIMQKKKVAQKAKHTEIFNNLISILHHYGDQTSQKLDIDKLFYSIGEQINSGVRKLRLVNPSDDQYKQIIDDEKDISLYELENDKMQRQQLFQLANEMSGVQFLEALNSVKNLVQTAQNDLFEDNSTQLRRNFQKSILQQPLSETRMRNIIQSKVFQNLILCMQDVEPPSDEQNMAVSISNFPDQMQSFCKFLSSVSRKSVLGFDNTSIPQPTLMRNVVPGHPVEVPLFDPPFVMFEQSWKLDGAIFGSMLGDIFSFMKVQNALRTNSKYSMQRVIVTPNIPFKYPRLLQGGLIDLGSQVDSGDVRYLEIINLRLHNICYDTKLKSVCDMNQESMAGFTPSFSLYAACVCLDGREIVNTCGDYQAIIVHESYVPVPLLIGGLSQPVVLLENKTEFASVEFEHKNPFFGVFAI